MSGCEKCTCRDCARRVDSCGRCAGCGGDKFVDTACMWKEVVKNGDNQGAGEPAKAGAAGKASAEPGAAPSGNAGA